MSTVAIVPTGLANLASVQGAFARLGVTSEVTTDPTAVAAAARVVLPGVGAFAAGMAALRAHDLDVPLRARLLAGRPTLAICLGMQLVCARSEEDAGAEGLGVIAAAVTRLPTSVRVPQLGWNQIDVDPACRLLASGYVYFAHSYCLRTPPPGWRAARAEHGDTFVAGLERDGVLLCQFHPELSSRDGAALLQRWLDATSETPC